MHLKIAAKWQPFGVCLHVLTHWGRVTHICVSDLTSIGSDNGFAPDRHQAIIRTNAGILLIRPLGTNFSEFLVQILIFSFKKMRLKVSSAKWRPFWCLPPCVNGPLTTVSFFEPGWQALPRLVGVLAVPRKKEQVRNIVKVMFKFYTAWGNKWPGQCIET